MEFLNDVQGSDDPFRPSIFELVAQEQLRDLLQPALKYVMSVFAQQYPRYLLRIVNKHEEFYAFLMFFVERHYLRKYGGSFAEHFYGLKRRRKPLFDLDRTTAAVGPSSASQGEKLRGRQLRLSLFFLVGIPYLRAKAQDYFESLGGGVDSDITDRGVTGAQRREGDQTVGARLRALFKKMYPWMNAGFEFWILAYNVAYLFDKTAFYRPWLAWIGVDLRRMSAEDYRPPAKPQTSSISPPTELPSFSSIIKRLIFSSPRLLLDSLKYLLPFSVFFIKFLEWWYSPSSPARSLSLAPSGPAVPPPKLLPPHPRGLSVSQTKLGECPICRRGILNATALPTGYVFCYKCIFESVKENGKCPVTLLPMRAWQLRKVLI